MGRRISTTNTGGVRRVQTYGLDPNAVAEQSGGDPQTRYTFGLGYDTPLAMTTSTSSAVFFQQDALSSVTSLTNAAGAGTGRATYDTYGQITTQTGQVSPYTYTGREHEPATGLYQYRARWYDPATGRFTSEDPVPAANLYGYADGDPAELNDPSGAVTNLGDVETAEVVQATLGNVLGRSAINTALGGAAGWTSKLAAQATLCERVEWDTVNRAGLTSLGKAAVGSVGGTFLSFARQQLGTALTVLAVSGLVAQSIQVSVLVGAAKSDDNDWLPSAVDILSWLPNFASIANDAWKHAGKAGVVTSAIIGPFGNPECSQ